MRLCSFFFAAIIAALPAAAQPIPVRCNGATCTFTLSFDDGYSHLSGTTGAPYSGQIQNSNSLTLPNGTNLSSQSFFPMVYRDSKGRVRTERHAYAPAPTGSPASPDDFVVAEIHDPIAGFEYVLDPVNRVAHCRPFQPDSTAKWDPSTVTNMQTQPRGSGGPDSTVQFLGTRTISGVLAYGQKTTWTRTTPGGAAITSTTEEWFDPASGEFLLKTSGTNVGSDTTTMTLANYSIAEPAPSLFQVPDGYKTVDENGSSQVVHQQWDPVPMERERTDRNSLVPATKAPAGSRSIQATYP